MTIPATQIEYFYSAHSSYAYLGAWELDRIARDTGRKVIHRPFDFRPVVTAAGGKAIGERSKAHIDYFFGREKSRWAEWRGLQIIDHRPVHHDNPLELASGMIIASDDPDTLSRAILQAHWRDDADISDRATLRGLADAVGQNGADLLIRAGHQDTQDQFALNTKEAIARDVFGSPTYFVDGDMFYGQDRLEMIARAIAKPFAP